MIVNKKQNYKQDTVPEPKPSTPIAESVELNPLSAIHYWVADIIRSIPQNANQPEGPKLFKTVKQNQGQLSRIKHNKYNHDYGFAFPAAFINWINVRWLVGRSRIGEAKAELRICYALNRLNSEDEEYQGEGYDVFQKIINAIEEGKRTMTIPVEKFQLTFFDQVEIFDDGLQHYWITYEVWFRDYSTDYYKDYVDVHTVIPPFTDHGDQLEENRPTDHNSHDTPTIEDAATFTS